VPGIRFLGTRIGDFGLVTEIAHATSDHSAEGSAVATPGKVVGTELYRPQSNRSLPNEQLDIYALGIILIELLLPFERRMERQQTLLDARSGILPRQTWSDRFRVIGADIRNLIRQMLGHSQEAVSIDAIRDGIEHMLRKSQST
jgi:serine/threonine protein kinase